MAKSPIRRNGIAHYFDLDYSRFKALEPFDGQNEFIVAYDTKSNSFVKRSVAALKLEQGA